MYHMLDVSIVHGPQESNVKIVIVRKFKLNAHVKCDFLFVFLSFQMHCSTK